MIWRSEMTRGKENERKKWKRYLEETVRKSEFKLLLTNARKKKSMKMYGFEYYIVSKKFEWLLGEDHHGVLIGIGQPMAEKIEYLISSRENAT